MLKPNEIIEQKLDYLKLAFFKENIFKQARVAAEKQLDHLSFVTELIDGETALRQSRAVERRIRNAKIPCPKSLDQFRWGHPDKINRQLIENLFHLNFIENRENVVFLSSCGLGKSHIASALAATACKKGFNTLFTTAVDIINNLSAAKAVYNLDKILKRYTTPQLLIIDELGYLPIDKLGADLLFQVVSKRYEHGSIVITSNRPFKKWGEIFNNDNIVTSAILDRIIHHCQVVLIEGQSYRMKDKDKIQ
ncbi:MAG: IS21-like element helper ATPase IstB [Victivallaceae bacterium]|nr:IS21-like element helper ATPase IstB [Victivallaceae bacterium]